MEHNNRQASMVLEKELSSSIKSTSTYQRETERESESERERKRGGEKEETIKTTLSDTSLPTRLHLLILPKDF